MPADCPAHTLIRWMSLGACSDIAWSMATRVRLHADARLQVFRTGSAIRLVGPCLLQRGRGRNGWAVSGLSGRRLSQVTRFCVSLRLRDVHLGGSIKGFRRTQARG